MLLWKYIFILKISLHFSKVWASIECSVTGKPGQNESTELARKHINKHTTGKDCDTIIKHINLQIR